jgi:hypothetical protein
LPGRGHLSGQTFETGLVLAMLMVASSAQAQDRVIGLLSLPEVYGARMCAPFEPGQIALHAAPNDGKAIAFLRVDQNWSFAPHGGCEGLKVSVHEGTARREFPTLEFDYEMPGAIVLDQRGQWFKVRLASGTGWLEASAADRFMPLADLFEEFVGVTAITKAFGGQLVAAPGRSAEPASPRVTALQPARVIEIRNVFGQAWVQVEVMNHSICSAAENGPPDVVGTGWMPLHASNGEPTIWFSSRGC